MTAHEQYEALANAWNSTGHPSSQLLEGYELLAFRCWIYSNGAKQDGVSALLQSFMRASEKVLPEDWLDDFLYDREACQQCGERYRLENLMLCTHCNRTYCHRCGAERERAANGNIACPCGGELVG